MHNQSSVTVTHEDLRVVETANPTASEVFPFDQRTVTTDLNGQPAQPESYLLHDVNGTWQIVDSNDGSPYNCGVAPASVLRELGYDFCWPANGEPVPLPGP